MADKQDMGMKVIETKRPLCGEIKETEKRAVLSSPFNRRLEFNIVYLKGRLARPFVALGISPNTITAAGLVFLIGVAYAFSIHDYRLATGFILLNGLCDLIDGAVARQSDAETPLGKLFDRTADKISDAFIFSLYLLFTLVPLPLGIYVIAATLVSTNLSANIEAVLRQPVSDALSFRAARYALMIVLTPFHQFLLLFTLLSLLITYSLVQRFLTAWRFSTR